MGETIIDSLKLEIDSSSDGASKGLDALTASLNKLNKATEKITAVTNKLPSANNNAAKSYSNLYSQLRMAKSAIKSVAKTIGKWITLSSDYTETMNLFTVSMGQYAEEAYNYAQTVGNAMGIDPADWMKNQGVFMTLTKGFGVVGDRANTMSQQLTQLGYDISSFFNISVEDAMTKLESGIAGELEPLRRLGYDLSQAKLKAVALSLGIDKAVSSMTQAEKAELRYYAIMTQVTDAHGDMARTLDAPANQLRILNAQVTQLGRSLGNFFIPLLNKVLPYIIASVKVLREVLDVFMDLLGIELADVDFSKGSITSATDDIVNNLEDGQKEAKKLKSYMMGFDELNVINTDDGSNLDSSLGAGFDFELPTYDFMEGIVTTQIDEIVGKMKEWLGITDDIGSTIEGWKTDFDEILNKVVAIGAGIAAWKLTKSMTTFFTRTLPDLKKLLKDKSFMKGVSLALGVSLAVTGLVIGADVIQDALTQGLESVDVGELVASSALIISGGALIGNAFGKALTGAAISAIVIGVVGLGVALYDAIKNELNITNGLTIAFSAALIGAGVGYLINGALGAAMGSLMGVVIGGAAAGAIWIIQNVEDTVGKIFGIVSAASLAVGAILAFSGINIPLGIGLMAVGAVAMGSQIAMNTNALSNEIKGVIAVITTSVSAALLAVGAILSFSGINIPLGIALMAGGALAMGSSVIPKWKTLSSEVQKTISTIMTSVGLAGLAIGAVLAFSGVNIPLGIGLMAVGALSLGTAVKLDWESVVKLMRGTVGKVTAIVGAAALAIGSILLFTGVATGIGLGLLLAGAASLVTAAVFNWDSIVKTMQGTVGKIMAIVGAAAMVIGLILVFTGVGIPLGLGLLLAGAASLGTAVAFNWDSIVTSIKGVWDKVKRFWNQNIAPIFTAKWWGDLGKKCINGLIAGFEGGINGIISGFESMINWIIGGLNKLSVEIPEWVPLIGGKRFGVNIRTVSFNRVSLPRFAQGGFPEMGQLFVAREAGAELVGNIGSRTAVMNNDQIVESVSAGVYQAVLAALGGNSDDGGETNIVINLDGEKIYENQQRIARGRGYNLGMGAFSFG